MIASEVKKKDISSLCKLVRTHGGLTMGLVLNCFASLVFQIVACKTYLIPLPHNVGLALILFAVLFVAYDLFCVVHEAVCGRVTFCTLSPEDTLHFKENRACDLAR